MPDLLDIYDRGGGRKGEQKELRRLKKQREGRKRGNQGEGKWNVRRRKTEMKESRKGAEVGKNGSRKGME